jgi:DNA polymerase elongation subunit (family B)
MGYQYGRYYRKEIAEAITLGGQWLNKQTKKWFEKRGYSVIYGDTDSVFVKGIDRDEIDETLVELHEFYDEVLNEHFGVKEHYIELEYEKRFSRLLLMKKKHYCGQLIELDGKPTDKFVVKGLECIKRDTIPLAKKWQRELINMIILEDHPTDFYVGWVREKMKIFFADKFELEDIVIRKRLSKHPTKYKTRTPHADLASEMMSREMECYVGMQIPYVVIAEKPIQCVHPDWYEGNASVSYYWDQQIFGILKRVLEVAFPSHDWEQYNTKIATRREKKKQQFLTWFDDPKRKRDVLLKKLKDDNVLSPMDKAEIRKKIGHKVFKIRTFDVLT